MVTLDLYVSDLDVVLSIFDQIKVYRADDVDGPYNEITNYSTRIRILSGVADYTYVDPDGTQNHWYRSSYYSSVSTVESSLSDPVRGGATKLYHRTVYPPEISFNQDQEDIVKRIRKYIGDTKDVRHQYFTDCTEILTSNPHVIDMNTKMWPLYVSVSGIEKNSRSDPYVDGYRYLTFSGIIEDTTELEIFYASFRFSDTEVYEAYTYATIPPYLDSTNVTKEHLILQTAIDLLESEQLNDIANEGVKLTEGDDLFDPTPGFRARAEAIGRLKKRLDDLVKQYMFMSSAGVRID